MQHHFHAVVWIDHLQARVFHLGLSGLDEIVLHPHMPTRHIHHKANSIGSGHVHESEEFLKQVLDAVSNAGEVLILGPAGTKVELAKYIREHDPAVVDDLTAAGVGLAEVQRVLQLLLAESVPVRDLTRILDTMRSGASA